MSWSGLPPPTLSLISFALRSAECIWKARKCRTMWPRYASMQLCKRKLNGTVKCSFKRIRISIWPRATKLNSKPEVQGRIRQGRKEEEAKKKKAHRPTRPDMEPSELAFGCRARRSLCSSPVPSAISSARGTNDRWEIRSILRGTRLTIRGSTCHGEAPDVSDDSAALLSFRG
jgi:hypothetical protein